MGFTPDSAQKVVHCTLSGTMFQGNEEWQTGFYLGSATADAPAPTQAAADAIRDAWQTFWTSQTSMCSPNFSFTGVKLALLQVNGKYDGTNMVESHPTTAVPGHVAAGTMPAQVSLVATLIGGSGKGLGGKGRMYLPGIGAPIRGDGHIEQVTVAGIAGNLAAFFNTIDANPDIPGHAINVSRGHKTDLLGVVSYDGARNVKINGVRVGNVYDTQRRRRNGLAETYSASVVND